jgi:hypothetical protein
VDKEGDLMLEDLDGTNAEGVEQANTGNKKVSCEIYLS